MKTKKMFITLLAFGLVLSGCNNKVSSSNTTTSSSSKIENTVSSSSSVFKGYVELDEAFSNTVYYGLVRNVEKENPCLEVWTEDMYYNNYYGQGFVELDTDPGYLHAFNTVYYDENTNDV